MRGPIRCGVGLSGVALITVGVLTEFTAAFGGSRNKFGSKQMPKARLSRVQYSSVQICFSATLVPKQHAQHGRAIARRVLS